MSPEDVKEGGIPCPQCGEHAHYQLSDGRKMCCRCRRKYTPKKQSSRLTNATLSALVGAFWAELPAEKAAQLCLVNRKTAQRNYQQIRQALAQESWRRHAQLGDTLVAANISDESVATLLNSMPRVGPELTIVLWQQEILALFSEELEELNRRIRARAGPLDAGSVAWPLQGWNEPEKMLRVAEHFWRFAQQRLAIYRGGIEHNYRLFLKEMEFRYNHQQDRDVERLLLSIVGKY